MAYILSINTDCFYQVKDEIFIWFTFFNDGVYEFSYSISHMYDSFLI